MAAVEEKSMVPTVLVGIGGTGAEVLSRVRRLVEETYGNLKNFPIISFLTIDTDRDYKITNPLAAGSPFRDNEKHWASVSGSQVQEMIADMHKFPWIDRWFPKELERNITALEAGAGQIRACGRFAFFCNYHGVQKKFIDACDRVKGQENFMQDKYNIRVSNTALNVFVTGSISGGTGSGMILDIGYCIKHWLRAKGQASPLITAIVPMPTAFAGIDVGDRVLANGYAALMELSYFSDHRTEYVSQFSASLMDEVRSNAAPFDFTYLVGTKNGESDFKLDQIRELIAQNIFLDLTSDFAPHKRSIRDNIKSAWANQDPGGRGYPKNFMSFGLSAVEIPIAQIRASLTNRLAADFVGWWLNGSVELPPQVRDLVQNDTLKRMRLTDTELISDLSAASDRSYMTEIGQWVNSLRTEISQDNLLQCTLQGVSMLGQENGKILRFVDSFNAKVEDYRSAHLRELSPDRRLHGDFFQKMYDNSNEIIKRGRKALTEEIYSILEDRTKGPKFADTFITNVRQVFEETKEKFRRESEKVWQPNETDRQQNLENALQDITHYKDKYGVTKQAKMEEYCQAALNGLEGTLIATIQRKARFLGLEVLDRMLEHLSELERRFARLTQKLKQLQDGFQQQANTQADSADALEINGTKLFKRQELNGLYQDLIEQQAGASEGSKSRYELGMDGICSNLSVQVLQDVSRYWQETRPVDAVFRLYDLPMLADVNDEDVQDSIRDRTRTIIINAPQSSRLVKDLAACDSLFKLYDNDTELTSNLRIAYNKSKPLILLAEAVMRGNDAGFTPSTNTKVALLGGRNTTNPAAQKLIPIIKEFIRSDDAITPIGEPERHRIIFVQETGGFSLRCIDGMRQLRQSYQDWKGETILAQRAKLQGEARDLPIPVHIQKEAPFWDIFPENPEIFKLVIQARALKVLRQEENRATQEIVIRYTRGTVLGSENVDLASSWEEVLQVLEVLACRPDREEIQRQNTVILAGAETDAQKTSLYQQLDNYLRQREAELEKEGGKDSRTYRRERVVILEAINAYKLAPNGSVLDPVLENTSPEISPSLAVPSPTPNPVSVSQSTDPLPVASTETIATEPTPSPIPTPIPSPVAGKSRKEQLLELEELHNEGLINEAEYQAARRKIIGL